MGTHRNVDMAEAKAKKGNNFREDHVCKYYLVGFCPQYEELFHSTKRDIGTCSKVHSDAMKAEFEAHDDHDKYYIEYLGLLRRYLEELVRNADDWVARERRNISMANQVIEESGPNEVARSEIKRLQDQAQVLMQEAETLSEEGQIQEAKVKLELADDLKSKADDWMNKAKSSRTEGVCEICGSRMESGDPARAKFRHQEGKIHLGYVKIRSWLDDVIRLTKDKEDAKQRKKDSEKKEKKGDDEKEKNSKDRRRSRSTRNGDKDRDRDRDRKRDKDRDRDKSRDRKKKDKDRSRDRDRGKSRDRDRRK